MANIVKRIVIEKLYDIYDYDITFDKGGITLLTGPNGYGKTTILNIIKNALDIKLWYFYNLFYSSIQIYWSDGTLLNIKKEVVSSHKDQQILFDDGMIVEFSDVEEYEVKISHIDEKGKSLDSTTLNSHRLSSLAERYYHGETKRNFLINPRIIIEDVERYSFLDKELRSSFGELRMFAQQCNCMCIQAQRIFEETGNFRHEDADPKTRFTITKLAETVKDMYHNEQRMYAEKSQQIDSTFIERQIKRQSEKTQSTYTREEYLKKLEVLKQKIANFEKYGLIDKYDLVEDYNAKLGNVLSMHIDDMNDKFSVYDKFYDKLERFDKFVSGKGLSNKKMILDPENGITFMSDSNRVIPLHKLSSGEQNIVILYYRLVFETNNETLVLMDEPENSIHIEWLKEMLNDYLETEGILKCQMIIATHSIPFIDGHWDIAYDLYNKSFLD